MGDDEYLSAFQCVLLPVAQDFKPQLILVSAGFDAALGDVGGCCVTPAGFAQMTRMLQSICPKLVLALEGGYKLGPMSNCVSACIRALLGKKVSLCADVRPKNEARLSIERGLRSHRPCWASLRTAESTNCITATSIPLGCPASSSLMAENAASSMESLGAEDTEEPCSTSTGCQPLGATGRRKKKERAVTGVSISTRNAAIGNWKGDMKKLARRELEINCSLLKIESLKEGAGDSSHGKWRKLSAKDRALLEDEDDLRWQLREISAELGELKSLAKDDVLRMYSGCR